MANYSGLQNGSDVRGVALAGVEGQPVTLTPEAAREIARAFVLWLADRRGKAPDALRVAVGRDSRLSGPSLAASVLTGLGWEGADCADCGMASTPAMFMSTVLPGFLMDGAVMITASHLPWNRNGLKFFTRDGGLESADIKDILARAAALPPHAGPGGRHDDPGLDLMGAYSAHLREVIVRGIGRGDRPLAGFEIAVDAGNGAGGFFAAQVLEPLGADTSASVFLTPDGHFPNHIPNPEDQEAMASIQRAVLEGGCDLGIIFDTDVDRAGAVDADGQELCRNRLIGLLGAIVAEEAPGSAVVTDSVTSDELKEFLEGGLGLRHHRFKRGYKNVIGEAVRLNQAGESCLLAIETSGHAAMKENYFLDDGAYVAVKLIIQMARLSREGRALGDLVRELREPLEAAEYRFPIDQADFKAYGRSVLAGLEEYARGQAGWRVAPDNREGLRISVPGQAGWFLLRMSLHDPLMPLNVESSRSGGVGAIVAQLRPFLGDWKDLDLSCLNRPGK